MPDSDPLRTGIFPPFGRQPVRPARMGGAFLSIWEILGQYLPIKDRSNRHTVTGDGITRLRTLRKERGYTQIKMQILTGIDQSDYSKLETGKRYYTYEQLRRIALALDTSMDYLAELTDDPRPYPRKDRK